jgi:hypothetical protein
MILFFFNFRNISDAYVFKLHEITIYASDYENFDDYINYYNLSIFFKDSLIFNDNQKEFRLDENPYYSKIIKTHDGYDILLEFDDRPFRNKILLLKIKNKSIFKVEIIPSFNNYPKDINFDGYAEYFGQLQYDDFVCKKCDSINYNPILYYNMNEYEGVILDSLTTIEQNKKFFLDFYGFKPNNKIKVKINELYKTERLLINKK